MRKFTESVKSIKAEKEMLIYYDLFTLLKGLEKERPGIKKRIWEWMCEDHKIDVATAPFNGRISFINLFYYGVGDEYPTNGPDGEPTPEDEIEHSKSVHPKAFKPGTKEYELRLDLNLIWSTYQDEIDNNMSYLNSSIEMFAVMVSW